MNSLNMQTLLYFFTARMSCDRVIFLDYRITMILVHSVVNVTKCGKYETKLCNTIAYAFGDQRVHKNVTYLDTGAILIAHC